MTGQQRAALKAAVDAKKREGMPATVTADCGEAATPWRYKHGVCRCESCRKAAVRYQRERRARARAARQVAA